MSTATRPPTRRHSRRDARADALAFDGANALRLEPGPEPGGPVRPALRLVDPAAVPEAPIRSPIRPRLLDGAAERGLAELRYQRRRLGAVALVAGLVVVAIALGGLAARAGPDGAGAGGESIVTVVAEPGDTLWAIARQVEPYGDPRPLVDRLVELNGGADLVAGQVVRVPVPGQPPAAQRRE